MGGGDRLRPLQLHPHLTVRSAGDVEDFEADVAREGSALIRIEATETLLNLVDAMGGDLSDRGAAFLGEQGNIPESIGHPIAKVRLLFSSEIEASGGSC